MALVFENSQRRFRNKFETVGGKQNVQNRQNWQSWENESKKKNQHRFWNKFENCDGNQDGQYQQNWPNRQNENVQYRWNWQNGDSEPKKKSQRRFRNKFENFDGNQHVQYRQNWRNGDNNKPEKKQQWNHRIEKVYTPSKSRTHMWSLPQNCLARVFSFLDWGSRIRCESVCKKFSSVLNAMYDRQTHVPNPYIVGVKTDWVGFPKRVVFAFIGMDDDEELEKDTITNETEVIKIRVPAANVESCNDIISGIIRKFYRRIVGLQFHDLTFNSTTLFILYSGGLSLARSYEPRWNAGCILMKNVNMNDVSLDESMNFIIFYGDRLTFE